jgi:hypothetical protein
VRGARDSVERASSALEARSASHAVLTDRTLFSMEMLNEDATNGDATVARTKRARDDETTHEHDMNRTCPIACETLPKHESIHGKIQSRRRLNVATAPHLSIGRQLDG